jgi:hypothetical protein
MNKVDTACRHQTVNKSLCMEGVLECHCEYEYDTPQCSLTCIHRNQLEYWRKPRRLCVARLRSTTSTSTTRRKNRPPGDCGTLWVPYPSTVPGTRTRPRRRSSTTAYLVLVLLLRMESVRQKCDDQFQYCTVPDTRNVR